MRDPDPMLGEVGFRLGDDRLILRCSYGALETLQPLLFGAPPEVVENRRVWLERNDGYPVAAEDMRWFHHMLGICAAAEVGSIPKVIVALAREHHPDLTEDDVRRASPSLGSVGRAVQDAALLCQWRPDERPEAAEGKDGPFVDQRKLWRTLATLLSRTGSARRSSAA